MKYDIVIHSYEGRLQNVFKIRSKSEIQMVHEIDYDSKNTVRFFCSTKMPDDVETAYEYMNITKDIRKNIRKTEK